MNSFLLFRVQGDMKYTSNQQSPSPKAAILNFLKVVVRVMRFGNDCKPITKSFACWLNRSQSLIRRFVKALINKESRLSKCYFYLVHMSQECSRLSVSPRLSHLRHIDLYLGFKPRYPCGKLHSRKTDSNNRSLSTLVIITFQYVITLN